jgi:hypothetical protein
MKRVVAYASTLGRAVLGVDISVQLAWDTGWSAVACYGSRELIINIGKLPGWEQIDGPSLNPLLIHEFAHEYASNHLSREFYDACCKVGAKMVQLAITKPELFQ